MSWKESFLTGIIQPGKAKLHAIDKPLNLNSKSRNAICLAAAFCFKQYNQFAAFEQWCQGHYH